MNKRHKIHYNQLIINHIQDNKKYQENIYPEQYQTEKQKKSRQFSFAGIEKMMKRIKSLL